MKFLDRLSLIKTILGSNKQSVVNNVASKIQTFMPMYGEPPKGSTANWIKTFNLNPRMNPVHQIASDVACAEFRIMNGENKVENHMFEQVLNMPCEDVAISRSGLFYITQVYLLLPSGEAFWLKERNGLGIPTQLWPVPPNWVTMIPSKSTPYFMIQPMGNMNASPVYVPPEDMVYFKKLNVTNPYLRGVGRCEAIGDEIETDEYMAKYQKKYFYNDAIPPMVGMMPGADKPAIERTEEIWQQKYGGYNNSNKMAWLGWDAKFQILKETTKEMDFVESRKYLRDTANQHFCIPPEVMGILENSNRATIDSAYYLYSKNVLRKELSFIADTLNRQLVSDYDKNIKFEFDNVVPEDNEFDLKKSNEGLSKGAITLDEWRIANGFEELPQGKGKVLYIPNNCVAISTTGKSIPEEVTANKPKPPTPQEKPTTGNILQSEKPDNNETEILTPKKKYKSLSDEERKNVWNILDKAASKNEESFKEALQEFFEGQEKRVFETISKSVKVIKAKKDILDMKVEDEKLLAILKPEWLKSMISGAVTVNVLYEFGINFDLLNPKFNDWILTEGAKQVTNINETTQNALSSTIDEGITNGESIPQIKRRVTNVFADAKGYRATLIARTETHNSVGTGTFETYKGAGLEQKEWLETFDKRTRTSHKHQPEGVGGEIRKMNEKFSNGLMYPGDSNGSASEVVACRCALLPIIPD